MSTNKNGSIEDDAKFLRLFYEYDQAQDDAGNANQFYAICAYIDARPTQPTTSSVPDEMALAGLLYRAANHIRAKFGQDTHQWETAQQLDEAAHPLCRAAIASRKLAAAPAPDLTERAADLGVRDAALEEAANEICTLARRYSADYSTAVTDAVNAIRALRSQPVSAPKGEQQ